MKQFWWAAPLMLFTGCSANYRDSIDAMKLVLHGSARVAPTAASVAAKPYFQLEAKSPHGRAVLILGGVEGDMRDWYGQDGQAVFLEHGVVARTLGLRQNIDDTQWLSANPFAAGLQTLSAPVDGIRVVDWSPGYRYNVTLHVHLQAAGDEDVAILGVVHHLRRIDERVSAENASFVAENHYWIDPADGFIWKSHQVIAPGLPLDLVQLRPYRGSNP